VSDRDLAHRAAATAGRRLHRGRPALIAGIVASLGAALVLGLGALPATALPGPPSKLAFTTGPATVAVGATQTIAVSVEDASGNVVTSDNSTSVTLAIQANPSSGTLTCASTLTVTDSAGVATFTGCAISAAGNGYTLIATASSLTSAVSPMFNVTGPASKLAFTTGPLNAPAAGPQTIAVSVEDASGNVVSTDSGRTVTLAIGTNPGGGTLSCTSTLSVADVGGVATFTGCAITTAGSGYTLVATASPLTSATSAPFTVTGPASKLAFTTGPVSEPNPSSTQTVAVSVEDAAGNVIGTDSGRSVTLAIQTNPGTGTLSCTSTLTVADVDGVASFTGCTVSAVGSGYTLVATASPLTSAVSSAFNIGATPAPTQIAGTDAIGTAIAISTAEFPIAGSAHAVVLARSDFFSDALAGGPLAASVGGPLLITPGAPLAATLDPRVLAEIQRVLPAGDTVYILGGDLALNPNIDNQLTFLGYNVIRLAGVDEFDTAVKIAQQLGNRTTVFLATGLSFYDALSAVPAAISQNAEILLTNGSTQDAETFEYLATYPGDTVYAVGGPLAAYGADPSATPIYGQDLYGTSAAVANTFFPRAAVFGAATSADFPDALGGGVFMATGGRLGPILLVGPSPPLSAPIAAYLASLSVGTAGYVFGGPLAVPATVLSAIQAAVG
jgi:putative cell wall-binding protein